MSLPSQALIKAFAKVYTIGSKQGFSVIVLALMLLGSYGLNVNFQNQRNQQDILREKRENKRHEYLVRQIDECKESAKEENKYFREVVVDQLKQSSEVMQEAVIELRARRTN